MLLRRLGFQLLSNSTSPEVACSCRLELAVGACCTDGMLHRCLLVHPAHCCCII